MDWLLLVFASMALYGLANLADKFGVTGRVKNPAFANALNASVLYAFLIIGTLLAGPVLLPLPLAAIGFATGVLFTLGGLVYFVALQKEEASVFIALFSIIPLFTATFAFLFLGERVPALALFGVVLIVLGAMLVSSHRIEGRLRVKRSLLLAIAAALPFAVVDVLLKATVPAAGAAPLLFWAGIGGLISAAPGFLRRGPVKRSGLSALAISGLLSAIAFFLFAQALVTGPASLAAGIIQIKPLLVFLLAIALSRFAPRLLKERIDRRALLLKAAAIALIILGTLLLLT